MGQPHPRDQRRDCLPGDLGGYHRDDAGGFFVGWPSPPSPANHLQLLEGRDYRILAIDDQTGRAVGFITAVSDGLLAAYIPYLEVLLLYQGQGIGSELMRRLFIRLENYYMVDLVCDEKMRPYYERFGLIPVRGIMRCNFEMQASGPD